MKLTDITSKGSNINENGSQLFIADADFSFHGLPILKDSLVYYDGISELRINKLEFMKSQENNIPYLITDSSPKNEDGIWNKNHFDKWTGSYSEYIDRIKEIPVLTYRNIKFSSLMYVFDTLSKSLSYFINAEPLEINFYGNNLHLPELLEIDISKDEVTIIPIGNEMFYYGYLLRGWMQIDKNGVLTGECAENFEAEIYEHTGLKRIKVRKSFKIEIDNTGQAVFHLYNESTNKIEEYRIRHKI